MIYRLFNRYSFLNSPIKYFIGLAAKRPLPYIYSYTLKNWFKKYSGLSNQESKRVVYFFCDEFTNYCDVELGIKAIKLLDRLGYAVIIPEHLQSGRVFFSKGLLRQGKIIVNKNLQLLESKISEDTPLIGIEPSALLSFRDEYLSLADDSEKQKATKLANTIVSC